MTFADARAAFPVLERWAYLNAGSMGPMARSTYDAMAAEAKAELGPRGGLEAFRAILASRERLRALIAGEIGVDAGRIALTTSTSEACRIVLAGLEVGPGDEVVTTDAEHFGMLGPLHASGANVRVAALRDRPAAEALEAILGEVTPRTRLIAVSHVLWITGHVVPLDELKDAVSVPLLVDGAQSVGAIPVAAEPFDFYTVSGQKWLCGPVSTGALYVRDPDGLRVGSPSYFSQASYEANGAFVPRDGAARFEQNWISSSSIAGLEAALAATPEWRFERGRELAERCRGLLLDAGHAVVTEPGHGTLVAFRWEADTTAAVEQLYADGVVIRDLPGTGLLRASCGYWTSEDDLRRLVAGLGRLAG
ncbi:MAG TPA: aminotransferase class V-fold PLP-dependent enzyme [Gaiellaceae bacterium]|nr:aminotransferase class V-fold PLP-dependent enzyme [Gaiellaceae bacterium]